MLRQKSLCIMKPTQKDKHVLSRNCSMKQIKVAPITSRVISPYSKDKNNKQNVGRSISHLNKQKMKEKSETKVQQPKQQKSKYQENKISIKNHINIKKDLKLLISKTLGNGSKKAENSHQHPKQSKLKINTSGKIDQKSLKKKEEPMFTKRHSICNLKVIKQQKYSKLKTSKASLSKISKTNSKQKSTDHAHDKKQSNKNEKPTVSGSASARFSIDSHLTSTLKSQLHASQLCFGSSTKKQVYESKRSNERPNFLDFFKKYRNSFDLKGIKHYENDRSKLKQAKNMNLIISSQVYKSNFQNGPKQKTQQSNRDQFIECKQAKCNEGAQKSTINQTQSQITCNNHSKILGKQVKLLNTPDAQRQTSETPEISIHNQAKKVSYKQEQNLNNLAKIPKNNTILRQHQREASQLIVEFQSFHQEGREKSNENENTLKSHQSPLKQSFELANKPTVKNFGQSKYFVPQIPAFRQKQVKHFLDLESPIPKKNLDDSIQGMQQDNIRFQAEQFQL